MIRMTIELMYVTNDLHLLPEGKSKITLCK